MYAAATLGLDLVLVDKMQTSLLEGFVLLTVVLSINFRDSGSGGSPCQALTAQNVLRHCLSLNSLHLYRRASKKPLLPRQTYSVHETTQLPKSRSHSWDSSVSETHRSSSERHEVATPIAIANASCAPTLTNSFSQNG